MREVEGVSGLDILTPNWKARAPLTSAVTMHVRDQQGCKCENGAHAGGDRGRPSLLQDSRAQGPRLDF